jgi:ribonuclease HI
MPILTAFFDGACGPINPGGHVGYGAIIYHERKVIWECSERFYPKEGQEDQTSNNLAEYCAFQAVVEHLLDSELDTHDTTIYGDSKLVIEQMSGRWKISKGIYLIIALETHGMLSQFRKLPTLKWIPREQNTIADALSKAPIARLSR